MVGKSLSHYKILEELGRGGMGIVYKAEDTKLDRTVAIKVLPPAALASEDDRARFYREAKAAAQLHHPNIASVFEIDEAVPEGAKDDDLRPFIAMEFIAGHTLDTAVKDAPLKLEDALRIGSEIASALEAAHEKNIVHRDIKSQNVMLTEKGVAKVLDFGLAQTAHSTKLTRMGSTLGTIAYMSPEQARSEEVDSRTDIWSLGVVLYEMISGRLAFPGDYEQAAVYSILNEDPEPLTSLRTGVPMALEWIVGKCLAKKADARYQTAKELLVDLNAVDLSASGMSRVRTAPVSHASQNQSNTAIPATSKSTAGLLKPMPLILALATLIGGFLAARTIYSERDNSPVVRHIPMAIPNIRRIEDPAMSPNGDRVAFQGIDADNRAGLFEFELFPGGQLYYYEDSGPASEPEYSPDGNWIIIGGPNNSSPVQKHRINGGVAQPIAGTAGGYRPQWISNETIIYGDSQRRVVTNSASGGDAVIVTIPDSTREHSGIIPQNVFKDGKSVTICVSSSNINTYPALGILDIETGNYDLIEPSACFGTFVGERYLLYTKLSSSNSANPGTIVVQRLAENKKGLLGSAIDLFRDLPGYAVGMGREQTFLHSPVVSRFTEAVFSRHDLGTERGSEIVGTAIMGQPLSVSPDGNYLARVDGSANLNLRGGMGDRIDVVDLVDDRTSTVVVGDSILSASWTSDGQFIAFTQIRGGVPTIQKMLANGSGTQTRVVDGAAQGEQYSPNGTMVAFSTYDPSLDENDRGVYILNEETNETVVIDSMSIGTFWKSFSRLSDYIVFEKLSSTGDYELVVKAVNGTGEWFLGPGRTPRWDGEEGYIYFENQGKTKLYRIAVSTEDTFREVGEPEEMVSTPFASTFALDFANNVAYATSFMYADLNASDAILNLTLNFDKYVQGLFDGSE